MHKVISIETAQVTRFITLENLETGTIDYCFDDSDIFNDNFYPMEEGKTYDCMLALFGNLTLGKKDLEMRCRVTRDDIFLGVQNSHLVEVQVGQDIYYIHYSDVENVIGEDSFNFYCARKDLIMVDGVLSGRYALDF